MERSDARFSTCDFIQACDDAWADGERKGKKMGEPDSKINVDDPKMQELIDIALARDYDALLDYFARQPDPLEAMKEDYKEETLGIMLLIALHHQLRPRKDLASIALRDKLEAAGENVLRGWRLIGRILRAAGVDTDALIEDFWCEKTA